MVMSLVNLNREGLSQIDRETYIFSRYNALRDIHDRMLTDTTRGPINRETRSKLESALYAAETEVLRTL
jgi:hypothetical protein